jgi:UDP-N-acetylmuramate--alanine ligase
MSYHFIGMGGIGMSALARVLLQRGQKVQGSDIRSSALLAQLESEGATVEIGHSGEMIHQGDTIVYSTDILPDNAEMQKAVALQLPVLHRSELLHLLMSNQKPLLVTGTHGKTTTSALLSAVLLEADFDTSFVIGGLLRPMNINGRTGKGPYFVAEADESDGSFLKTAAFGAIVTNLGLDHLNFWKTPDKLRIAFREFFEKTERIAHLFWCRDDEELRELCPKGISYGFSENAELRIENFSTSDVGVRFDLSFDGKTYKAIDLALNGRHNALNGAAVFGLALSLGANEEAIRRAFARFGGAARRLEWLGSAQNIDIYDDYGHHPTEIRATLSALRGRIRERRLVVLFQPHRYTRGRDLFNEFLGCFEAADELLMTDIHTAGEAPINGISAASLYTRLREKLGSRVRFFPRQHLENGCAALLRPGDSVITLGAGDITSAGRTILEKINELQPKLTVGVLFGGTSAEHDISLLSAGNVLKALDPSLYQIESFAISKEGVWFHGDDAQKLPLSEKGGRITPEVLEKLNQCDVCFPVFHGTQGEDGMIQGLLEALDLPYVGCDYRSSALCMQKSWTKQVAMMNAIPTASFFEYSAILWRERPELLTKRVEEQLSFPVWVKPVHLGSSIGVSRAENVEELQAAAARAFSHDDVLIVEKEVVGRQIEFAVMGNDRIQIGQPGEILNHGQFYDYERKYGAGSLQTKTPAELSPLEVMTGLDLASRAYQACGCAGLARVDFFLDAAGNYWLNEINPLPGFTSISLYPKMWEAAGMTQRKLCNELVVLALHRHRRSVVLKGIR